MEEHYSMENEAAVLRFEQRGDWNACWSFVAKDAGDSGIGIQNVSLVTLKGR
jgi:hypothetical protein